jgi:hypothetical protein
VAIGRGALECVLGILYLVKGTVTFSQAGLGVLVAALISVAYVALYPRKPGLVQPTAPLPAGRPAPSA